jgi:hypothetical protein
MKKILLWLLALTLAIIVGYRFLLPRPQPPPASARTTVEIRDRATLDFSTGQPVVRDDAAEKALIDAVVTEMNEAAKNITFEPLPPPKIEIPPPPKSSP